MSERDPYSRIYWRVMEDEEFDGIREDVRLFGSWSLMLLVADMAYPAPAFIPPTVPASAVRRLVDAELVSLLPGHRYRLRGQTKEREKRSESGRNAAAKRWQSEPTASRAEQSKEETSTVRARPNGAAHGTESVAAVLASQPFAQLVAPPPGYVPAIRPVPKPSQRKKRHDAA